MNNTNSYACKISLVICEWFFFFSIPFETSTVSVSVDGNGFVDVFKTCKCKKRTTLHLIKSIRTRYSCKQGRAYRGNLDSGQKFQSSNQMFKNQIIYLRCNEGDFMIRRYELTIKLIINQVN